MLVMGLGIALSVGLFFAVRATGDWAIRKLYLSEEATDRRNRATVERFQAYASENGLASRDTEAIALWAIEQKDVYILLYKDRKLALEAGWWGVDLEPTSPANLEALVNVKTYQVNLRDGLFQAVVYDFSESRLYDFSTLAAVGLACALFALLMLSYNRRITKDIASICQEVQQIGDGNLSLQLEPRGRGEIGQLMHSVEAMRASLIKKTNEEQDALAKNSELISAISHDIRNPLTALLGYLDLLRREQYTSKEEAENFVEAAYGKAEQLRQMTDELLQYSLLFGRKELPLDLQDYDAQILLSQLLGEQAALLEQMGFLVQMLPFEIAGTIAVDVRYVKRVLDNLFDNVRKHADPEKSVTIGTFEEEGSLHVCIGNAIRQKKTPVESNKIGLKTCEKILKQMNGRLERHMEADKFSSEIVLPLTQGNT